MWFFWLAVPGGYIVEGLIKAVQGIFGFLANFGSRNIWKHQQEAATTGKATAQENLLALQLINLICKLNLNNINLKLQLNTQARSNDGDSVDELTETSKIMAKMLASQVA